MDLQDFIDTPRKQMMLAGSVIFMLIFPAYFAVMPSLIGDDLMDGSDGGVSGLWDVSFAETPISTTENVNLGNGDSHDSFFDLETESNIAWISFSVSCQDNDDPAFNDGAEGQSDVSGVEGDFTDQSDSGGCGNGDAFSFTWQVVDNYSGSNYTQEGDADEIFEFWSSNGEGVGTWAATITADINSAPGIGGFLDNDEDYDITWTAVTFEVILTPILNVET